MSVNSALRCTAYLAIAAGALACGERAGPLEPADASAIRFDGMAFARSGEGRAKIIKRTSTLGRDVVVSATITPAGGVLTIEDAGLLLVFPRGAVKKSVVVTATAVEGKNIVYSLEPHGTQFSRPIAIAQLLNATTYQRGKREREPAVHGGYLSRGLDDVDGEGTGTFSETYPAVYWTHGRNSYLIFFTNHFSAYAVASGLRKAESIDGLPTSPPGH